MMVDGSKLTTWDMLSVTLTFRDFFCLTIQV
jgi:hypothetical protein